MTTPRLPAHQDSGSDWYARGDSGGFFPTAESAEHYKRLIEEQSYHRVRHQCLRSLLRRSTDLFTRPPSESYVVLDFGIGDGGEIRALELAARKIYGFDTSEHMIRLAEQQFQDKEFVGCVGGAERLAIVEEEVDALFCINTLGYLSQEEDAIFWHEAQRLLRPGGFLIIMTGNLLFDLFALNSGTADFFASEFKVDGASSLLTRGDQPRFANARRRNPLQFASELKSAGFRQLDTGFCMWHSVPPELLIANSGRSFREARWESRDFSIYDEMLSEEEKWQMLFRCSIFASVSIRDL